MNLAKVLEDAFTPSESGRKYIKSGIKREQSRAWGYKLPNGLAFIYRGDVLRIATIGGSRIKSETQYDTERKS